MMEWQSPPPRGEVDTGFYTPHYKLRGLVQHSYQLNFWRLGGLKTKKNNQSIAFACYIIKMNCIISPGVGCEGLVQMCHTLLRYHTQEIE